MSDISALAEMARSIGSRPNMLPVNPATVLFMLVDWHRRQPPRWRFIAHRRWRRQMDELLAQIEYGP